MQPYDPKLYENDPVRKAPGLSTDRAVRRGDKVSEEETGRRRFSLDPDKQDDPEKRGVSAEKEGELPSAFSLAAPAEKVKSSTKDAGGQSGDQQQMAFSPFDPRLTEIQQSDKPTPLQKNQLIELAKEMLKSLEITKKDGITETRVVLTHPPIFEGATLSIKAYDTAKGELNLTFSDLSPKAKELLDRAGIRQDLTETLHQKGFTVHIFIATTEFEKPLSAEESERPKDKQEKENHKDDES